MSLEDNRDDFIPDGPPADSSANGEPHDEHSLLTAYALGELGEDRLTAIEARLRESPDERQLVEALARLGRLLRKVVADVPLPDRSAELREQILAQLAGPSEAEAPLRLPERFPRRRLWLPLSLAASIAVVCGTLFGLMKSKHSERAVAERDRMVVASLADGPADTAELDGLEDLSEEAESANNPAVTFDAESDDAGLLKTQVLGEGEPKNFYFFANDGAKLQSEVAGEPRVADPMQIRTGVQDLNKPTPHLGYSANASASSTPSRRRNQPTDFAAPASGPSTPTEGGRFGGMSAGGLGGGGMMSGSGGSMQGGRLSKRISEREAGAKHQGGGQQEPSVRGRFREQESSGEAKGADLATMGEVALRELPPTSMFESRVQDGYYNTESYPPLIENPFRKSTEHPLSTFSIDVDTASYTNVRRFLNSRAMPPPDAVRIEELINYFQYSYPQPEGEVPFSVTIDVADCPWNAEHRLLRVGLKGREVAADQRPASNLVFLLDVSGSMEAANKLPLVKEAMYLLTDKLTENDRVAIVVYAGNSGMVLPPTNGTNKAAIRNAISQLVASGSTNGGQGLQMAYDTAQSQFVKGGTNRVILATDGDFNVGVVDQNDLVKLIEEKAKGGVFLSALGFGVGNLKDGTLEKLADKGNGNYAYIDTLGEARRVLVEQLSGTLVTIAKDVKLQIEFNPAQAADYRLIGYEDRIMPHQDFHDDRKDAGEIGAGHSVTALYEIVPGARATGPAGEPLKYQRSEAFTPAAETNELATIKLRYKQPEGNESRLIERVVTDLRPQQAAASQDLNFAAAVASFGMLLRQSPYRGTATYKSVLTLAEQGLASDLNGYRSEFVQLVKQAREISGQE